MPIQDAVRFMHKIQEDTDFRSSLYEFNSSEQITGHLQENGYKFSMYDLEEAYNSQHVQCQTHEAAELLTEIYRMSIILLS